MFQEISRAVPSGVERELWARSAGRCQFRNCNRICYRSPITQAPLNISEGAHIYSFSPNGPRGRGDLGDNHEEVNGIENIMLLCRTCHKEIDHKNGVDFPAEQLLAWKRDHEARVVMLTGFKPECASHVILYGASIGAQKARVDANVARMAMFPDWFPADYDPKDLSISVEDKDSDPDFWRVQSGNLEKAFARKIVPLLEDSGIRHFSVFGIAPMPLLAKLGSLLTQLPNVRVYQLHREPGQSWKWQPEGPGSEFVLKRPTKTDLPPALIISLSAKIVPERVEAVFPRSSIWELTIGTPYIDFLKTEAQLSAFREATAKTLQAIEAAHGKVPLNIFPAMPVACAVEFGRLRLPKADIPFVFWDQNNLHGKFIQALTLS